MAILMGSLFGGGQGLTNVGIIDPSSGAAHWVPRGEAAKAVVEANRGAVQPSMASSDAQGNTTYSQDSPNFAKEVRPSPQQAAQVGASPGGVNAASPALNKAGKLITLLRSGLQGALAGRAASEQATAASGGRRSGGAGMGFEAAQAYPWQQAMQQQSVERGGLENQMLGNQVQYAPALNFLKLLQGQAGVGKTQAEAGKATAETAAIPQKTALEAAQAEAAHYKDDPNLGLIDLRTGQPINPSALAPLTAEEAQVLGKQPGDRVPLKLKNTASEIAVRGLTTVNTEEGVYERNRNTGTMTRLGANPRMVFAPEQRIVPAAADPNNPGALTYMRAGQAMASGAQAPGSANVQAAKKEAVSEVPTKIGDQKVAFNTALQHADLLKSAIMALGNGDQNTLNSLKNRFKAEFGATGPVTAEVIAGAYTREINKMLSSGHMTDAEIGTIGKTLNVNRQSPQQSLAVLDSYRALAQSKMKMLTDQANAAKTGGAKSSGMTADDMLKKYPPR